MNIDSVLNLICSKAASKEHKPVDCNLLDELLSTANVDQQNEIRNEIYPAKQIDLKNKMPVLLPSGRFEGSKGKAGLKDHTGLMVIDIDEKDNLHIKNFYELKQQFVKISNVAYCGLSVRGKGYFLIIPIAHPDKHELHFDWLKLFFAAKGLNIDDSCRNVNRLRFCSHDPAAYYNHAAKPLQAYYVPPIVKPKNVPQKQFKGEGVPVWKQYNEGDCFIDVLQKHDWQIESKKGQKIYFTRPGKTTGVSAEFDYSKNVFFVFTSSTEFEPSKGYNPFAVYAVLDHAGDYSKATKALILPTELKGIARAIAPGNQLPPPPEIKPSHEPVIIPVLIVPEVQDMTAYYCSMFANHYAMRPKVCREKYLEAWYRDMEQTLTCYGITKQSFSFN